MGVGASPLRASQCRAVRGSRERVLEGQRLPAPHTGPAAPGSGPASGNGSHLWPLSPRPTCVSDWEAAQRAGDGEWEREGDVRDADGAGAHPGRACRPGAATGEHAASPQVTSCSFVYTRFFPTHTTIFVLTRNSLVTVGDVKPGTLHSIRLEFGALQFSGLNRVAPLPQFPHL